jgi:hypothetical protein
MNKILRRELKEKINFSLWCDFIERDFLDNGFKKLLENKDINGATSNPSIFESAFKNSKAYKNDMEKYKGLNAKERYEKLALSDIKKAGTIIMKDKDIKGMLDNIMPLADYVIYTRPLYSRSAPVEVLEEHGKKFNKPARSIPSLAEAINKAKDIAKKDDLILVTGSLFTVGEALSYIEPVQFKPDEITE